LRSLLLEREEASATKGVLGLKLVEQFLCALARVGWSREVGAKLRFLKVTAGDECFESLAKCVNHIVTLSYWKIRALGNESLQPFRILQQIDNFSSRVRRIASARTTFDFPAGFPASFGKFGASASIICSTCVPADESFDHQQGQAAVLGRERLIAGKDDLRQLGEIPLAFRTSSTMNRPL
jgi:hypothetical protein